MFDHRRKTHPQIKAAVILITALMLMSCNTPFSFIKKAPTAEPQISSAVEVQPTLIVQSQPTSLPEQTSTAEPQPLLEQTSTAEPPSSENDINSQIQVFDFSYTQDFTKTPPEWDYSPTINADVEVQYSVMDGEFIWQAEVVTDNVVMKVADPPILLPEEGFFMTVSTKIEAVDSPISSGLMFRFQDFNNFYFAKLSDTGEVNAYALQDNQWNRLAGPVKSEHFIPNQVNRLTVVDHSGQYELRVNDYPALNFKDERFQSGSAGLIIEMDAGMKGVFSFDDLWIMNPGASAAVAVEEEPPAQTATQDTRGSFHTYPGDYHGVTYEIDYPMNFSHSSIDGWEAFCRDNGDQLCVAIHPQNGNWNDPQEMAHEIIEDFSSTVSNFDIYHEQHTTTFDGFNAYWIGCTYTMGDVDYGSSRMFVLVQHVGFDIAGYGDVVIMEEYATIIKEIMDSFRFTYN